MGFFAWLTEGVRRAIVRGIEQAAEEINEGGEAEVIIRLPTHRERPRLGAPAANGRRKVGK